MHCPYCVTEISPRALVCPQCRRDLYLAKPLMERIAALEAEVETLEAKLASNELAEAAPDAISEMAPTMVNSQQTIGSSTLLLRTMLLPVIILLAGHLIFDFLYDARPIYLRLLALLAPLPFGFWLARRSGFGIWRCAAAGLAMAGCAVIAMGTATGLIDHVPILPESLPDIRDYLEFITSIALSFITGAWLARWHRRRVARAQARRRTSKILGEAGNRVSESLNNLNDLSSALIAIATTACSIYT